MTPGAPVLIAGGGIGGLTAALALAREGVPTRILEQREAFSEAGAGIQLGPNATRILMRLGLGGRLEPVVFRPERIVIRQGASARVLATVSLGTAIEVLHGAPYWALHRAELQEALLGAVRAEPLIAVSTGWRVMAAESDGCGVTAIGAGGERLEGRALIGADGLWSALRGHVAPGSVLRPSGRSAWRAIVERSAVSEELRSDDVGLWLGPRAHLVHYPVAAGAKLAIIAVIEDASLLQGWDTAARPDVLISRFSAWHTLARDLLASVRDWRTWTLHEAQTLPAWVKGRLALLGDAAHPVLPFLAQGGALAIEDAAVLARVLANAGDGVPEALQRFQAERLGRAARVQAASRRNGIIYHLRGPAAAARDAVLRLIPGQRLLAGFDWLYAA